MKENATDPGALEPNITPSGVTPGDGTGGVDGSAVQSPQDDNEGTPNASGGPAPKRRRITRACDECRRKKIKCDGKQVIT
jgi:hypothetical protein